MDAPLPHQHLEMGAVLLQCALTQLLRVTIIHQPGMLLLPLMKERFISSSILLRASASSRSCACRLSSWALQPRRATRVHTV
jgi:hypothetical protein